MKNLSDSSYTKNENSKICYTITYYSNKYILVGNFKYCLAKIIMNIAQEIISCINNRQNVLLYGPGGTGKSYMVKEVVYALEHKFNFFCTATTGIAAINLGMSSGLPTSTIHSFSGIGLGQGTASELFHKVAQDDRARKRWLACDVLVVDEISMLGQDLIYKLDYIGRNIRRLKHVPFGGITLLLVGDFLQLPPVKDGMLFKYQEWENFKLRPFVLTEPKRYPDLAYFNMLLRFRKGIMTGEDYLTLEKRFLAYQEFRMKMQEDRSIIKPTMLYSRKLDVEEENLSALAKLEGKEFVFNATDNFKPNDGKESRARYDYYIKLLDDAIPRRIVLKKFAQVMLRFNLDVANGLANGSRGVVTDISPDGYTVFVKFLNGCTVPIMENTWEVKDKDGKATRTQIPLTLAWSSTIHKCVSGNTVIFTDDKMLRIGELGGKLRIGWNELLMPISVHTEKEQEISIKIYKSEPQKTVRVTTKLGFVLEGSEDHRIKNVLDNWVELKDAKNSMIMMKKNMRSGKPSGEYVKYHLPSEYIRYFSGWSDYTDGKTITIDEDVCYLFGIIMSSATFYGKDTYKILKKGKLGPYHDYLLNRSPKITKVRTHNEAIKDKIVECAKTAGLYYNLYSNNSIYAECPKYNIIFSNNNLLTWLFDTNKVNLKVTENRHVPKCIFESSVDCQISFLKGVFDSDTAGPGKKRIYFDHKSKTLCQDLQMLLLNIGIISGIKCIYRHNNVDVYHKLYIRDRSSYEFLANVSFRNTRSLEQLSNRRYSVLEQSKSSKLDVWFDFVESVNTVEEPQHLYDLEVDTVHNYVTGGFVSHNCQGLTLDYAICDIGPSVFAPGQAYVALSRVKCLTGLFLCDISSKSIKAEPDALEFDEKITKEYNKILEDYLSVYGNIDDETPDDVPIYDDETPDEGVEVTTNDDEEVYSDEDYNDDRDHLSDCGDDPTPLYEKYGVSMGDADNDEEGNVVATIIQGNVVASVDKQQQKRTLQLVFINEFYQFDEDGNIID